LDTDFLRHWLQRQQRVSHVDIEAHYDQHRRAQIDAKIRGVPAEAWNKWKQTIYKQIRSELSSDYHNTRLHRLNGQASS